LYGTWYGTTVIPQDATTLPLRLVIGPGFIELTTLSTFPTIIRTLADPDLIFDIYDVEEGFPNFRARLSGTRTDSVISGTSWNKNGLTGSWTVTKIPPEPEPIVFNQQGSFELRYAPLESHTETLEYTWQNSGSRAEILQPYAIAILQGVATLIVQDATGAEVYRAALTPDAYSGVYTSTGTPGSWTIRLELINFTGAIRFNVRLAAVAGAS